MQPGESAIGRTLSPHEENSCIIKAKAPKHFAPGLYKLMLMVNIMFMIIIVIMFLSRS